MRSRTPSETSEASAWTCAAPHHLIPGGVGGVPPAGRSVLLRPYIFPLLGEWAGWRRRTTSVSRRRYQTQLV